MQVQIDLIEDRAVSRPKNLGGRSRAFIDACKRAGAYYDQRRGGYAVERLDQVPGLIEVLKAEGFAVNGTRRLVDALAECARVGSEAVTASAKRIARLQESLQARGLGLYPYQREGIYWLASVDAGVLGDDPGLGKTIQMLAALPEAAPAIVVCPAVARGVWVRECEKWRPDLRPKQIETLDRWPSPGEVLIFNPERVPDVLPAGKCPGLVVVADEAHMFKTLKARRTVRFRALAKHARRLYALTGTPILNEPRELWTFLTVFRLATEAFGDYNEFLSLFNATEGPFGTVFGAPKPEVPERLRRVMLKRLKADVLTQLPPKVYADELVPVSARHRREADKVWKQIQAEIEGLPGLSELLALPPSMFELLTRARRALAMSKWDYVKERVALFEDNSEPVVVFSCFGDIVDELADRPGWAKIDGSVPAQQRTQLEESFQRGELKGLAATIRAAGVALTLTRSANVIFVDREFTPALNLQAEDRCYRIGTSRNVLVTRLVADHPLDKRLDELLASKSALIAQTVTAAAVQEGTLPSDKHRDLQSLLARIASTSRG